MGAQEAFSVSLCKISDVVEDLGEADLLELAGLGSLLDWELVKFLAKSGWSLCRLSFTWKDEEVLLVVKVLVDDTPYVAFVSRQNPISCVRTLVRKMNAGDLAIYPDKYA